MKKASDNIASAKEDDRNKALIEDSLSVLDSSCSSCRDIAIAYSGGKDSTVISLLFLEWLDRNQKRKLQKVYVIHNDTLGEIPLMKLWARKFMKWFSRELEKRGVESEVLITTPPLRDTFFWRMLMRGYPAPSFKFRWCVDLLKILPTRSAIEKVLTCTTTVPLPILTGLRDGESGARSYNNKRRTLNRSQDPTRYLTHFFMNTGIPGTVKIAPIRKWKDKDVWGYLEKKKQEQADLEELFQLYMNRNIRYGCWFCTLIKVQWPLLAISEKLSYLEAVRILIRKISDIKTLRIPKNDGYSRLGPLNPRARAVIIRLLKAAEELSGLKVPGLDEPDPATGITLRQILYTLPVDEAQKTIRLVDPKIDGKRLLSIEEARKMKRIHWKLKRKLEEDTKNEPVRAVSRDLYGIDPVEELLSYI